MQLRSPTALRRLSACLFFAFCASSVAAEPDKVQKAIDIAKSEQAPPQERVDAAAWLKNEWAEAVPVVIKNINGYYRTEVGPPFTPDDAQALLPLTDILASIVVNNPPAVKKFREEEAKIETVKLLTWATRRPRQGAHQTKFRFNAAYILASVVDNGTLCIILDHLQDEGLGVHGTANLLQVAAIAVRSANTENTEAARKTVSILKERPAKSKEFDVLLNSLEQGIEANQFVRAPSPSDAYCSKYDYDMVLEVPED